MLYEITLGTRFRSDMRSMGLIATLAEITGQGKESPGFHPWSGSRQDPLSILIPIDPQPLYCRTSKSVQVTGIEHASPRSMVDHADASFNIALTSLVRGK